MRHFVLLAVIIVLVTFRVDAQTTRARVEVSKVGPQVGERVPDFSLQDQFGKTQTPRSIMGPRGAMLVFLRSADW